MKHERDPCIFCINANNECVHREIQCTDWFNAMSIVKLNMWAIALHTMIQDDRMMNPLRCRGWFRHLSRRHALAPNQDKKKAKVVFD